MRQVAACTLVVFSATTQHISGAQVVTVNARFVMHNASDEPLQYGQRGSRIVWQLAPAASTPFHWSARPNSCCTMRQLTVTHACEKPTVTNSWRACAQASS